MLMYNQLISAHLQCYCCMSNAMFSVTHGGEELEDTVPTPNSKLGLFDSSIVPGIKSIVSFYYMMVSLYMFIFCCHTKKIHPDSTTVYIEQRRPEKLRVVVGMCGRKIVLILHNREYNWDQKVGRNYLKEFILF